MKRGLLVKGFALLVGSILVGVLALLLVFLIPENNIVGNVEKSIKIFEREGTSPQLFPWCESFLDNFTDAIMLHNACYEGTHSLVENAMLVYRSYDDSGDTCKALSEYISGKSEMAETSYARYWHGYLLFLKPLLLLFDYGQIRMLNLIVQTCVNILLLCLMYRKGLKRYILPYLFGIGSIMPVASAFSLQFSSVFYLLMIGSVVMVLKYEKWKGNVGNFYLFFMGLGIMTSFLDFLTYPLATLGIVLVFYMVLSGENKWKEILGNMFSWGIGYIGMWGGKWIAASLLTGENVIMDAVRMIGYRSSMGLSAGEAVGEAQTQFSILDILIKNVGALMLNHRTFLPNPVMVLFVVYMIVLMVRVIKQKKIRQLWKEMPYFAVLALLPFAWYLVASNHSYLHFWFTYKELMISVFAVACLLEKAAPIRPVSQECKPPRSISD